MKKRCHEAKEHWINTQCEEIEANTGVNSKTVHQEIKEVRGKKAGCIRSKGGDILMEKEDILNRWSEYITELYHDERGYYLSPIMMKAPELLRRKFKKMKKRRGRGTLRNTIEMLTALGQFGIIEITKLLKFIHDSGEIPTDLKKSVYIAIPNKNRYN